MTDITFNIPDVYKDKNVLLKVQNTVPKLVPLQTFRSFGLVNNGGCILIRGIKIDIVYLLRLLIDQGMPSTIPVRCKIDDASTICDFDWKPMSYTGPNVWHFKWGDIDCSITGNINISMIYIRVHNMTPGVGESVLKEITDYLYVKYKPITTQNLIIYTLNKNYDTYLWRKHSERVRRSLDTIYIDPHLKTNIINEIQEFMGSSDLYDKYGVTWKRVHLFHGMPGTGKTSTIIATAGYFGRDIAKLTITPDMNSQQLEVIFSTVPDRSFVLLEDVDSFFIKRDAKLSVDFSTLLNCLDGVTTKRGMILFMTTNHIQNLDEALVRPGRVDMCVKFENPDEKQIRDALNMMAEDFKHEHDSFITQHKDISIAALQKHLFECHMQKRNTIL